jgi:hypothetical protein
MITTIYSTRRVSGECDPRQRRLGGSDALTPCLPICRSLSARAPTTSTTRWRVEDRSSSCTGKLTPRRNPGSYTGLTVASPFPQQALPFLHGLRRLPCPPDRAVHPTLSGLGHPLIHLRTAGNLRAIPHHVTFSPPHTCYPPPDRHRVQEYMQLHARTESRRVLSAVVAGFQVLGGEASAGRLTREQLLRFTTVASKVTPG